MFVCVPESVHDHNQPPLTMECAAHALVINDTEQ